MTPWMVLLPWLLPPFGYAEIGGGVKHPAIANAQQLPTTNLILDLDPNATAGVTLGLVGASSSGTTPPALTWTGTPTLQQVWIAGTTSLQIALTSTGIRGTAQFTWYLNGVAQATGQTTAATYLLGSTGVTANFPVGAYTSGDVYTVNVGVSTLKDVNPASAGNGDSFIQTTNYPPYTTSDSNYAGRPSMTFNGTNSGLSDSTFTGPQKMTVGIVFKASTTTFTTAALLFGNGSQPQMGMYSGPHWGVSNGAANETGGTADTSMHCFVATFDGSVTDVSSAYIDSSASTVASGAAGTNSGLTALWIANRAGSYYFPGSIARVVVYSGIDTTAQISALYQALSSIYKTYDAWTQAAPQAPSDLRLAWWQT